MSVIVTVLETVDVDSGRVTVWVGVTVVVTVNPKLVSSVIVELVRVSLRWSRIELNKTPS